VNEIWQHGRVGHWDEENDNEDPAIPVCDAADSRPQDQKRIQWMEDGLANLTLIWINDDHLFPLFYFQLLLLSMFFNIISIKDAFVYFLKFSIISNFPFIFLQLEFKL